jgi:GT2 family glycosyltransferase/glycosyltransferase involved in cell wall biosynthesis
MSVTADEASDLGDAVATTIDVVVPVYNAPADVRACIESVLAATRSGYRLILIDDGSSDPEVAAFFAELERRELPHVTLLRNDRNMGFTATANRAMTLSRQDVVLLNSDTEVSDGWLDALARCAASDPRIGTITPFSNNAEICSFPAFCENNPMPSPDDREHTASALARAAVPTYPDLPTGVGFCLYIKRALIDAIGTFDPAFGAGYGEENDFCMRAARAGFRNVLCDDAFVAHSGGRSFAGRKSELSPVNTGVLTQRHPQYTAIVREYIVADPLRPLREFASTMLAIAADPTHGVLHLIHDHGGGTEMHVRALIASSEGRWRHYLAIAVGDAWQVEEHCRDGTIVVYEIARETDETWRDFLHGICATFGIGVVHAHNISRCRAGLLAALSELELPLGYTVHDLNFACPTITLLGPDRMYCGGITDVATCGRCLAGQSDFAGIDIATWRAQHGAIVRRAAFLIAPSKWAAAMLARYFPGCEAAVVPHGTARTNVRSQGARSALLLPRDDLPVVAVLGAIGPDKGARRIERLVSLARERGARVRFVLIGYLDVQHVPWQSDDARFTVHGRYESQDLPDLLAHYRVSLVVYPSAGPETFSYTLSEAWSCGLPVLVPPIGALAERVSESGAGFVMTTEEWRDDARMLERIESLVSASAADDLAAASSRAGDAAQSTLREMTDATFATYTRALGNAPTRPELRPLARARVRDALGYRAWTPPAMPVIVTPMTSPASSHAMPRRRGGLVSAIARAALAIRHTAFGNALYRYAPAPVVNALRARLKSDS